MSLRLIRGDSLSTATAQTGGMIRSAAISGDLTGASALWMGRTVVLPGTSSGDHHHGDSETGIYVVSGHPVFVFRDPDSGSLVRLEAVPGSCFTGACPASPGLTVPSQAFRLSAPLAASASFSRLRAAFSSRSMTRPHA